jgi:DNA-binding ferritin-like protein
MHRTAANIYFPGTAMGWNLYGPFAEDLDPDDEEYEEAEDRDIIAENMSAAAEKVFEKFVRKHKGSSPAELIAAFPLVYAEIDRALDRVPGAQDNGWGDTEPRDVLRNNVEDNFRENFKFSGEAQREFEKALGRVRVASANRVMRAYLEQKPTETCQEHLLNLLALLRAQSHSYQHSHWQVVGGSFYGNHQLFERLYSSVQKQIDELAEKIAGLLGSTTLSPSAQARSITDWVESWEAHADCHHRRGLKSEQDVQDAIKLAYDTIKAEGTMTLGLDDWLMATANAHEENTYLLQQAIREPA